MIEPGLATEVKFIRVVDGDTIEVEVSRRFNVRIRDIDTPELPTKEGIAAKNTTSKYCQEAKKIIVFVPSNNNEKLMDINSFDRIVADVYLDGTNLAHLLVADGVANKVDNKGKKKN